MVCITSVHARPRTRAGQGERALALGQGASEHLPSFTQLCSALRSKSLKVKSA